MNKYVQSTMPILDEETVKKYFKAFHDHNMENIQKIPSDHLEVRLNRGDKGNIGYTVVHLAVMASSPKANLSPERLLNPLQHFIENHPEHLNVKDSLGRSPIFTAVTMNLPEAFRLLWNAKGIDKYRKAEDDTSLLTFMLNIFANKDYPGGNGNRNPLITFKPFIDQMLADPALNPDRLNYESFIKSTLKEEWIKEAIAHAPAQPKTHLHSLNEQSPLKGDKLTKNKNTTYGTFCLE